MLSGIQIKEEQLIGVDNAFSSVIEATSLPLSLPAGVRFCEAELRTPSLELDDPESMLKVYQFKVLTQGDFHCTSTALSSRRYCLEL